jgi:hypothetical protein
METSNEIISKVFAGYLGCEMIFEKSGRITRLFGVTIGNNDISLMDSDSLKSYNYFPFKLLLTPLSAISDEDAIEVAKMLDYHDSEDFSVKVFIERGIMDNKLWKRYDTYQYLQSRSYDLPHYLLGGKTLHQSGLCIYQ